MNILVTQLENIGIKSSTTFLPEKKTLDYQNFFITSGYRSMMPHQIIKYMIHLLIPL